MVDHVKIKSISRSRYQTLIVQLGIGEKNYTTISSKDVRADLVSCFLFI